MPSRFLLFITLLFIKVIAAPLWYASDISNIKDPLTAFEHIRVHKRRSCMMDDVLSEEAEVVVQSIEQRILLRIITVISAIVFTQKDTPLPHLARLIDFTTPLFLRLRVLRL